MYPRCSCSSRIGKYCSVALTLAFPTSVLCASSPRKSLAVNNSPMQLLIGRSGHLKAPAKTDIKAGEACDCWDYMENMWKIHGLNGTRLHIYLYTYIWEGHIFSGGGQGSLHAHTNHDHKNPTNNPISTNSNIFGVGHLKTGCWNANPSVFAAVCALLIKTNTRGLFCMFPIFGEDTILPWYQQPNINQICSSVQFLLVQNKHTRATFFIRLCKMHWHLVRVTRRNFYFYVTIRPNINWKPDVQLFRYILETLEGSVYPSFHKIWFVLSKTSEPTSKQWYSMFCVDG